MALRQKTKKNIKFAAITISLTSIIWAGGTFVYYQKNQEHEIALNKQYEAKLEELKSVAAQSEIAYALTTDVVQGTKLTPAVFKQVYVPASAAPSDRYITIDSLESSEPIFARADLKAGMLLTDAIVYKEEAVTKDMRKGEYAFIELPSKLKAGEYVDVRIQFPSGDDFILFSKKKVTDVRGLNVWFNVDEGDVLMMSSAIVDAYVEGAKIYALPYVDAPMQEGSELTYPVKTNVKELIQSSPNIVNIAKLNLEQQNRARMEIILRQVDAAVRDKIKSGEANTQTQADVVDNQLTAEERINQLNEMSQSQQQDLVGGTNSGGEQ